jgi:hypothetical protein
VLLLSHAISPAAVANLGPWVRKSVSTFTIPVYCSIHMQLLFLYQASTFKAIWW